MHQNYLHKEHTCAKSHMPKQWKVIQENIYVLRVQNQAFCAHKIVDKVANWTKVGWQHAHHKATSFPS